MLPNYGSNVPRSGARKCGKFLMVPLMAALVAFGAMPKVSAQAPGSLPPFPASHGDTLESRRSKARASVANIPLGFEPNRGQLASTVSYVARGGKCSLFLTSSEAVFVMPHRVSMPSSVKAIGTDTTGRQTGATSTWTSIAMKFVGAAAEMAFSPVEPLPGQKNYFVGRDQTKWASGVPIYSKVVAHDVYPGIDLVFRGVETNLEFDLLVNGGADPKKIKFAFEGERQARIESNGDLRLSSEAGDLELHRPVAYQVMPDGTRKSVKARFVQQPNKEIRLALGRYDRRRQLVLDPSISYASYLGGTGQDEGLGVAIDGAGNMYVTGATGSPEFPNTGGGFNYSGGLDVFVTEFDSSGQLVFSTLVGGSADDVGTAIAVSDSGPSPGIFVTGYTTSPDYPAFTNQLFLNGRQNAFVFILDYLNGDLTRSSTYLGGEAVDAGLAITFDTAEGYVYVAGQTTSQQFPVSSPLLNDMQLNMGAGTGASDAFVAELFPDLSGFYFSTFLGGGSDDFATGIALDHQDSTFHNIYITGGTRSGGNGSPPSYYTTPGVLQSTCGTDGNCNGGQDDAFVTVLCTYLEAPCNAIGLTPNYVYSTFLGGSGKDDAYSIAVDEDGNAYITGQTSSTDFKLAHPFQGTLKGQQNAFVSKLNAGGISLAFSTYLGGSQTDTGLGLAIDTNRNVYLSGCTNSPDFPLQFPTQGTIGGGNDAFITSFNPSGSALTFSTFLGGSGDEDVVGGSIAVDSTQNVYVTGDSNSTDFPTQNAYQGSIGSTQNCTINGNQVLCPDAFIAKLNVQPPTSSTLTVTVNGGPMGAFGSVSSDPPGIDQCSDDPNNPGVCTANFANGTLVTLTAMPINDQFGGWGGDVPSTCGTNLTCQVQVTSNMQVTATFNPVGQLYSLTVQGEGLVGSQPGTGTITSSPAGIDCGTGGTVCQFDFAFGTEVILTATPDPGSFFFGWEGNLSCSGAGTCSLVMGSNQTVGYIFLANGSSPPQPDFTITVSPQSLGVLAIGSQGVAEVAITTLNQFMDTINLTCSVLPASASSPSCAVNPGVLTIPLNGAGSTTLTINTTGLTASKKRHNPATELALGIPFLGTLLGSGLRLRLTRRRNWVRLLLGTLVLGVICFVAACGGSGGGGGGGVAQPGAYTVIINAQGAGTLITHTAQVTVTVQ